MASEAYTLPQGATATRAGLGLATTDSPEFAGLILSDGGTPAEVTTYEKFLVEDSDGTGGDFTFRVAGASYAGMNFASSGGTLASPSVMSTSNLMGAVQFFGHDGTTYKQGAGIYAIVDGTPGTNDMPTRLQFETTSDGASTPTARLILDSAGVLKPASNDGLALGNTTRQFSDLFLAEGGVINWDNGDITLTQSGNTLTLAGGTLVLPAVTTTVAPLKFTTGGTLLTTAEDGAIEMDDDCFYGTIDAGNRGYIPVRHFIRADSSRSLPNDTNENAIFNDPTNGTLTLETGTYFFEGIISVSGMSATSGNASIDILGAGTATCGTWLWSALGRDNNSATAAATVTGSFSVSQQSAASVVSAGTGTGLQITIQGTFEVTSAGTVIPSIDLVTASATTLAAGSYLVFERIGSTSVVSVGQWS